MGAAGQQFFHEDEAEEILRLASTLSQPESGMTRERLMATASELGISEEAVIAAEKQVLDQRSELSDRREYDHRLATEFKSHLVSFLIVNGFLAAINFATGIRDFWVIYPILGWGIGLAFHAFAVLNRRSSYYDDGFERFRARKLEKLEEEAGEIGQIARLQAPVSPRIVVGVHVGSRDRRRRDL